MPSFSSTLLDEIYRSIDGNVEKAEDFKSHKEKPVKKQGGFRSIEDEKISIFTRDCLVEKWMKNEVAEKVVSKRKPSLSSQELENKSLQDNDFLFFSSTSSSSDSSGQLSSSDTEFFGSTTKPKASCFITRPKPIRTSVHQRENCSSFDDYQNRNKVGDDLIKSKSRALKIYANLKKVKQPISPGGRLTSFINSLFSNANGKKSKNVETSKGFQDLKSPKLSSTTCSSASSYSRSCLSKYSPNSREKMRNGIQRTVRFNPVSVIVDEDLKPCGHKSTYDEEEIDRYKRPPLPPTSLSLRERDSKVEVAAQNVLKGYYRQRKDDFSDDEDDDAMSDSSSDLFELDHLTFFGSSRYHEELPVYETTHFNTNRAIASGLIG
ncbi:hypothetical protein ACJIZ3_001678 [Penstemon smallii]|uniref:Protein BIG GRAIN 1-like B n=1 Tax=Penstemon smallii TaxID=265156 RepID=A0ABD3U5M0_9LAMI